MIKKYLLNTVAAIVLSNVCTMPVVFSMQGSSSGSARRDFHNELPGVAPVSGTLTAAPRVLGGVMMPIKRKEDLILSKQQLNQQGYRRSHHAPYYPLFNIPRDSWEGFGEEDFKRILDRNGSKTERLCAFNRLNYCVEKELHFSWRPEHDSIKYNENLVSMVRWLAKAVLWSDSTMDASEQTSFNPILQKILDCKEDGRAMYGNYLDTIYYNLCHAVKIQKHLIEISSGDERLLSDVPTVSNARRILGVLKADQARVYELKLLKRKMDDGLVLSDPASNSLADRLQILRKYAYDFYEEAKSYGGTKLCIIQQMKLIDMYGYSPTGDKERDKAVLLDLGERYVNEKDVGEVVAVRIQARPRSGAIVGASSENRMLATIPKPQRAKDYIAGVFGKYVIGDLADPGRAVLDAVDSSDHEVEWDEGSSTSSATFSLPYASRLGERMTVGSSRPPTIDTNVTESSTFAESSTGTRSGQLSSKSPHLSATKQTAIKAYFSQIGGREGAVEKHGSLEEAYRKIAVKFGVTKYQAKYAMVGQDIYQRESAEKRKAAAAFSDGSDNESTKIDERSDDEVVVRGAKRGRHIVISDSEASDDEL